MSDEILDPTPIEPTESEVEETDGLEPGAPPDPPRH